MFKHIKGKLRNGLGALLLAASIGYGACGMDNYKVPSTNTYTEIKPACSDGIDNDGDGLEDLVDPGCYDSGSYDPKDNDELDTLPECSDYFDNNNNGLIDELDPGCSDSGIYDQSDENEDREIIPVEYNGKMYDRLSYYDHDKDGINDGVVLCEIEYCPEVYTDFNGNWEKKVQGVENSHSALVDTVGFDNKEGFVEYHIAGFNGDSTCTKMFPPVAEYIYPNVICDYSIEKLDNQFLGLPGCIDPNYPEACPDPSTFQELDTLEANYAPIHELLHYIFTKGIMAGNTQENFTYPIAYLLSSNSGQQEINSFGDLNKVHGAGLNYNNFLHNLNLDSGFDINDFWKFSTRLEEEYSTGNYYPSKPIPIGKIKCIMDTAVGADTSKNFIEDICIPNSAYCNLTNPASSSYIKPYYCGE